MKRKHWAPLASYLIKQLKFKKPFGEERDREHSRKKAETR